MLHWTTSKNAVYYCRSDLGHRIYKNPQSDDMVHGVLLKIPRIYCDYDILVDTVDEAKKIAENFSDPLYDQDTYLSHNERNIFSEFAKSVIKNLYIDPKDTSSRRAVHYALNELIMNNRSKLSRKVISIINKYTKVAEDVENEIY